MIELDLTDIGETLYVLKEYLPGRDIPGSIDQKHRVVIPSYYRDKTASRLRTYKNELSQRLCIDEAIKRFTLVPDGEVVAVLDALAYQLAHEYIIDRGLNPADTEANSQGRIVIPPHIYKDYFKDADSVLFRPSENRLYFTMEPNAPDRR